MKENFELEINEKEHFEEGICRILDKLHTDTARYLVVRSRQHHSIHEARTNIKKIRGMLRLLRHDIGSNAYNELNDYYKNIAQEISVLRDDTSQIELLFDLKDRAKTPALTRMLNSVIKQLHDKRKREFEQFKKEGKSENIQQTILVLKNKIHELDFTDNPESFIRKGLHDIHHRARNAWQVTGLFKQEDIYHYWRKQVKYLMYHLMVLNRAWPLSIRIYTDNLKKLGSLLGQLHDLDLFTEAINNNTLVVSAENKKMLRRFISTQRAGVKRRIKPLGERTFNESSEAFAQRIFDIWMNSVMNKKAKRSLL